jgi:hypothetical protein
MNRIVAASFELTVCGYRHDRHTEMETMVKHIVMWRSVCRAYHEIELLSYISSINGM